MTKGNFMVQQRMTIKSQTVFWLFIGILLAGGSAGAQLPMEHSEHSQVFLVQVPYAEPPSQPEYSPGQEATPAPESLSSQDQERLESLIPLLEGKQEFWAMGEFVHYGKHSVPYLVKALKMPDSRIRFNAVETLAMINDPSGTPGLLDVAVDPDEEPRIRSHALRIATRLDAGQVLPALKIMAEDPNSSIRKTAVFEARFVHRKDVLPIIIKAIADPEQYVSITARDSFWILTRFAGSIHDWEASTPEERKEWVKEWWAWWEENKDRFENSPRSTDPPAPSANRNVS